MKSLELAKEYYKEVNKTIDNMTMVLYGSTVFGVNTSDLDLCFFREKMLPNDVFEELKNFTYNFHVANNLRVDEEISYDNKLIYTYPFIETIFSNSPFPYCNGKYIIPPIEKNSSFLNSEEMKKRLLLNILTVKHIVMGSNEEKVDEYSNKAWEIILKTVISYSENMNISLEQLLEYLYKDPFSKKTGELYLGYKTNLDEKVEYITSQVESQLNRLIDENKLVRTLRKTYIPDKGWLNK